MNVETTCNNNNTTKQAKLYMAMECGQKERKLGFSVGPVQAPRLRSMAGRELGGLMEEIWQAKRRFGLGEGVEVEKHGRSRKIKFHLINCTRYPQALSGGGRGEPGWGRDSDYMPGGAS